MAMRPRFRLSVPESLWIAVADVISPEFADSYLFGADLTGTVLEPRTLTGYRMMRDRGDFMALLGRMKFTLKEPKPWKRDGEKLSSEECY